MSKVSAMSSVAELAVINNALISIFEMTLLYFETDENPLSPEVIQEMSQRLMRDVSALGCIPDFL